MTCARAVIYVALGLGLALAAGCQNPNAGLEPSFGQSVAEMPLRRDIVQVKKFFPGNPWLSFDEAGDLNPEGFKVNVYLVCAANGRGVFGDGEIIVSMYHAPEAGEAQPRRESTLAKQWILGPEESYPFRAKRRTVMGYGYGLRLNWGEVDVLGKTVIIRVDFQRRDGTLIKSQPQTFRVPPRREVY